MRRTNLERTESMRATLIEAARSLFVGKGYSETSTPDIVAAAGVTRGALYHHFDDKKALFRAVIESEARQVGDEIEASSHPSTDARAAILAGTRAYFDAMSRPGRTRLLLLDGPAVLGGDVMRAIDGEAAEASLTQGLAALLGSDGRKSERLDVITDLISATFDRAALAIEAGGKRAEYEAAVGDLIDGLIVR